MKQRWSWDRWLKRLARSPLSRTDKDIVGRLATLGRRRGPRWIAGWQIGWERGVSSALWHAELCGLTYRARGNGMHIATIVQQRRPGSIVLTPAAAKLLDELLSGSKLYHVIKPGQITSGTWTGWIIKRGFNGPTVKLSSRRVDWLGRRGLLDADGTVWFSNPGYRCRTQGLTAIRNRTPRMSRCLAELSEHVNREQFEVDHELRRYFRGDSHKRVIDAHLYTWSRRFDCFDSGGYLRGSELPDHVTIERAGIYRITYRVPDFVVISAEPVSLASMEVA